MRACLELLDNQLRKVRRCHCVIPPFLVGHAFLIVAGDGQFLNERIEVALFGLSFHCVDVLVDPVELELRAVKPEGFAHRDELPATVEFVRVVGSREQVKFGLRLSGCHVAKQNFSH